MHLVIIPKGTDQTLSTADGIIRQMLESGVLCGVDQLYRTKVGMAAAQIPNECVTVSRQPKILGSLHSSI